MKETLLCLEEKCLLSLFSNSGKISFYCNGFNVVDTLLSFSDLQDIVVANLLLEEGAGVDYRSYTIENLPTIKSYSTLKDTFKKLSCDVFIYDLSFSSRDISVAIHDNRDFSIVFNCQDDLGNRIVELLRNSLHLPLNVPEILYSSLKENFNNLILINQTGQIIGFYRDFDDYLVANKD